MDCILNNQFLSSLSLMMSGKLPKTLITVYFLFENSLDIFLLLFYNDCVIDKRTKF